MLVLHVLVLPHFAAKLICKLFFAIRGGGSNFGVATSFTFRLRSIPPVCWSGVLFFSPNQLGELVKVVTEWKACIQSPDDSILMGITHSQVDGSPVRAFNQHH